MNQKSVEQGRLEEIHYIKNGGTSVRVKSEAKHCRKYGIEEEYRKRLAVGINAGARLKWKLHRSLG